MVTLNWVLNKISEKIAPFQWIDCYSNDFANTTVNIIFLHLETVTVKPVYNDHLGDEVSMVVIDRWSL